MKHSLLNLNTMLKQVILRSIIIIGLLSCKNESENQNVKNAFPKEQKKAELDKLKIDFNQPVIIDSSVYVMYPLSLKNDEESEIIYSSSYGKEVNYWNIIFYNTANGEYHLLNDSLKMVIHFYSSNNTDSDISSSEVNFYHSFNNFNKVSKLLYYSITTQDFNNDGKLNSSDPNYLYVSDKTGNLFKQVSPNNLKVLSWETVKETNKILLVVMKDSNGDKIFNDSDESFPMVYDLTKNTISKEIFNNDFKNKLKMQLKKQ